MKNSTAPAPITAYVPEVRIENGSRDFRIFDDFVGVQVGYACIIRGFIHYTGSRRTAHEGVEAVISPSYPLEDGRVMTGDPVGALTYALKHGIKNGRRDDLG